MPRRQIIPAFASLFLLALAGCSSTNPGHESVRAGGTGTPAAPARPGELGPQTLQPDECALFLWTATEPRRFIFFSKAGSKAAKLSLQGMETDLIQTGASGDLFGQFMTETVFSAPGQTITVSLTPGEEIEGGQRIRSGKILIRDGEGWETILPVLGLRACQPGGQPGGQSGGQSGGQPPG